MKKLKKGEKINMSIFSDIKTFYLFYQLKKAIIKKDDAKVEKYLMKLENKIEKDVNINFKFKSEIYYLLGVSFRISKNNSMAEDSFIKEIAFLEKCDEVVDINFFHAHYSLSEIYFEQDLFEDAVRHYLQALSFSEKIILTDDLEIHLLLRGLVISYFKQNLFKEAEPYARRELALRERLDCVIYDCLTDLGFICFELEKYTEAKVFFLEGLRLIEELMPSANTKQRGVMNVWKEAMLERLVDIDTFLFQYENAQSALQKLKVFNPKTEFVLPICKINSSEESLLDLSSEQKITPIKNAASTISRNDLCQCGSGKKYKKCHGR